MTLSRKDVLNFAMRCLWLSMDDDRYIAASNGGPVIGSGTFTPASKEAVRYIHRRKATTSSWHHMPHISMKRESANQQEEQSESSWRERLRLSKLSVRAQPDVSHTSTQISREQRGRYEGASHR